MADQPIVSRVDWLRAREELLGEEKAFTKARDELAQKRRKLPWVRIEKDYEFQGPEGVESLSDLFADKGQLVVYHFMYGPDWDEGCPSCSFWADNFDGVDVHLAQRLQNQAGHRRTQGAFVDFAHDAQTLSESGALHGQVALDEFELLGQRHRVEVMFTKKASRSWAAISPVSDSRHSARVPAIW